MALDNYDLEDACDVNGPEEARQMYGNWAATYDESFGKGWGYVAPREIAARIAREVDPDGEILDIGAGFGSELARMVAQGRITPVAWRDIPIYEGKDHPHAHDRGLVMVFRRV